MEGHPTEEKDETQGAEAAEATGEPGEMLELRARMEELEQQNLRLLADFENQRRRRERDQEELRVQVLQEAVLALLPVADDLSRALQAALAEDPLRAGVSMIEKSLQDLLRRFGAEPIEAIGQMFDPGMHDAVGEEPSEEPPGTVVQELRRGWRLAGRVVRPALVRVAGG